MSKSFEQNFSLKDWVTKRAANMPEAGETETAEAASGYESLRAVNASHNYVMDDSTEPESDTPKIAARVTTTSPAPGFSVSPTQQIQIVRLLRDLGDRLRQSEKEREILWKELESCRDQLADIEDKTNNTEKAYLTLEHKLSTLPDNASGTDTNEFRKTVEEKLSALETTTGSAVLRLENAIGENERLARRLDTAALEKNDVLRKMSAMEETLNKTQETLKAKALVLLTDQALASRTLLPQTPAEKNGWSGNDTIRTQKDVPATPENAWWKNKTSEKRVNKAAWIALIGIGITAGFIAGRADIPRLMRGLQTPENVAAETAPVVPAATNDSPDQQALMDNVARLAAQIEPGTNDGSAIASDTENPAMLENAARSAFEAEKPDTVLASRISVDKSLPLSVRGIESKAFDGDATAQHDLAAIYATGHAGVKANEAKAFQWFSEAAHNGHASAQYNLGVFYQKGMGVAQDTGKAIELYRLAAAQGHADAQYNLGVAHVEGIGVKYDPQLASGYFKSAAASGIADAAYHLGQIEENGLLGEARPDEAIFWYKIASEGGNEKSGAALSQFQDLLKLSDSDVDAIVTRVAATEPAIKRPGTLKSE